MKSYHRRIEPRHDLQDMLLVVVKSAILFHLYSGDVWFTGLTLAVVAIAIEVSWGEQSAFLRRFARVGFLLSVPLAALAGVPVAWWIAAIGLVAWVSALILGFGRRSGEAWKWCAAAFVIFALSGIVSELVARGQLEDHAEAAEMVVVFGDSLTSGGFEETRTWPTRLRDDYGLDVVDLALASATTASAIEYQLPYMPEMCDGCVAVIELGGNDMLGEQTARGFEQSFAVLVEGIRERGALQVWMLEFPVLPGKWHWAAAQRRAARQTGVGLIPKRVLASVLLEPGSTLDGLHLSDTGHENLAEAMARYLMP